MQEYLIKRVELLKLKDIQSLYKNAFNLNVSLEFLQNKYDTSFSGASYIGYIAYAPDGTPAAYYGVFPCLVEYLNNTLLAAQSGDTMTHSEHRGKGLFILLANKTYDLAKKEGIKFVFGFPNKNSYPGFVNKLNWLHKEDMNVYELNVTTIPLAKAAKKIKLFNPLYKAYCQLYFKPLRSSDKVPGSVIDTESGGVIRNKAFYNYKTYSGSFLINVSEKALWIKMDGYLWLGDMENCSQAEFNKIINKLKRHALLCGADKIVFQTSPGTQMDKLWSSIIQPVNKVPIGYLDLGSGIHLTKIKYTGADFDTF